MYVPSIPLNGQRVRQTLQSFHEFTWAHVWICCLLCLMLMLETYPIVHVQADVYFRQWGTHLVPGVSKAITTIVNSVISTSVSEPPCYLDLHTILILPGLSHEPKIQEQGPSRYRSKYRYPTLSNLAMDDPSFSSLFLKSRSPSFYLLRFDGSPFNSRVPLYHSVNASLCFRSRKHISQFQKRSLCQQL